MYKWEAGAADTRPDGIVQDEQEQAALKMRLAQLRLEHDAYHAAIEAMIEQGCDRLQIQRMKKKKLDIKDEIARVSSQIIPDIIA